MQEQPIQKVIEILKEKGLNDEQIADVAVEIMKTSFSLMYTNAIASFTEEDVQAIEAMPDDEVNTKVFELYKLRTGKDPEEEMSQLVEQLAEKLSSKT